MHTSLSSINDKMNEIKQHIYFTHKSKLPKTIQSYLRKGTKGTQTYQLFKTDQKGTKGTES